VRRVRQLLHKRGLRQSEGALVLEGADLLSAALGAGAPVEAVYVAPGGRAPGPDGDIVERAYSAGARVFDLAPGVLERIADTVTPQPVIAVVGYVPGRFPDVPTGFLVVVCVEIRDPGNAGTMIRTADAAGADAVIFCDGTVDPTNPKTVRASAGSLFHVPVMTGPGAAEVFAELRRRGFVVVGSVVRGGSDYASFDWRRPTALVFGNESSGLDTTLVDILDERVSIPMRGKSESLNVASAAAVLCFESLRQRRSGASSATPGPAATSPSTMLTVQEQRTRSGSP
jgi:RNA methyltransferase, TrmH family